MPQPDSLDPSAYAVRGGPVGALLIHGFTGSVAETRPMGEYLAERGLTVDCHLLPGHGTHPQELTRVRWQDWAGALESALEDLQNRCEVVFVGGLSLGALLTLWLGAEHPEVAGLIPMAPIVKARNRLMPLTLGLRHLFKYSPFGPVGDDDLADPEAIQRIWCYDQVPLWGAGEVYLLMEQVRQVLPTIRQPLLIFQGLRDAQVPPEAAQMVYDVTASGDKTLVWLEHSGHNLLVDGERESVWALSHEWMMGLATAPQDAASRR
jgi:carboxylesterase